MWLIVTSKKTTMLKWKNKHNIILLCGKVYEFLAVGELLLFFSNLNTTLIYACNDTNLFKYYACILHIWPITSRDDILSPMVHIPHLAEMTKSKMYLDHPCHLDNQPRHMQENKNIELLVYINVYG
jgi:hypothetical protein